MSVFDAVMSRAVIETPAKEHSTAAGLAAVGLHHVSASQIGQYLRCPRQWSYVKVLKLRVPPDGGLVSGSAVHTAAEVGMRAKMETGENPAPDASADIARDYVREQVAGGSVSLEAGQAAGALVDKAARVARAWAGEAAPTVEPVAVEETVEREIAGVTVTGRVDVRTVSEVVDWKTTGRKKSRRDVIASPQSEVYPALTGLPVRWVFLIDSKTGGVKVDEIAHEIHEQHDASRLAEATVADVARGMALGVWPRRREGWQCSKRWCGFYERCMSGRDDDDLAQRAEAARAATIGGH